MSGASNEIGPKLNKLSAEHEQIIASVQDPRHLASLTKNFSEGQVHDFWRLLNYRTNLQQMSRQLNFFKSNLTKSSYYLIGTMLVFGVAGYLMPDEVEAFGYDVLETRLGKATAAAVVGGFLVNIYDAGKWHWLFYRDKLEPAKSDLERDFLAIFQKGEHGKDKFMTLAEIIQEIKKETGIEYEPQALGFVMRDQGVYSKRLATGKQYLLKKIKCE